MALAIKESPAETEARKAATLFSGMPSRHPRTVNIGGTLSCDDLSMLSVDPLATKEVSLVGERFDALNRKVESALSFTKVAEYSCQKGTTLSTGSFPRTLPAPVHLGDWVLCSVCEFISTSPSSTAQITYDTTGVLGVHARGTRPTRWLNDLISKINGFSHLGKNWDSYKARPISGTAIAEAVSIASQLARAEASARIAMSDMPFVAPMSLGGILFELKNRSRQLHIEVHPSKTSMYEISRIWVDASGNPVEEDMTIQESDLPEVLSWIVQTS